MDASAQLCQKLSFPLNFSHYLLVLASCTTFHLLHLQKVCVWGGGGGVFAKYVLYCWERSHCIVVINTALEQWRINIAQLFEIYAFNGHSQH